MNEALAGQFAFPHCILFNRRTIIMKRLHLALVLTTTAALSGCISIPASDQTPRRASCTAADYSGMIGTPIAAATFLAGVRVLGPDTVATQDYAPNRLNVLVDAMGVITGFKCG